MILRFAGMMISPVWALTTSSGIFSPSRMFESASVSCSCSSSFFFACSSSICFACRFDSAGESLIRVISFAARDLDVHDDAVGAGRHGQRGVLHVRRLLAEDRAQQALFGREFGFRFRRDFPDEDVARLHFGADANDAVRTEVAQRFLADVRNVARDFLRPELGVAGADLEFVDVDRGIDILLDDSFAEIVIASSKL